MDKISKTLDSEITPDEVLEKISIQNEALQAIKSTDYNKKPILHSLEEYLGAEIYKLEKEEKNISN